MRQSFSLRSGLAIASVATLMACSKDESVTPTPQNETGTVVLEFDNVFGEQDLALGTTYTTPLGEDFTPSTLAYYVSNVQLQRADGTWYTVPQDRSYFLVNEAEAETTEPTLTDVPAGTYTALRFVLGVDSLRSVSPLEQRTGALDPAGRASDMYWSWNSGYIFVKLEGHSSKAAGGGHGSDVGTLLYHIGGFGGLTSPTISNIRTVTVAIPEAVTVAAGRPKQIHLLADVARIFDGTAPVRIAEHSTVMFTDFSTTVSANMATMFSVDHAH